MSDKRYEANIIRTTAVEPANNIETTSAPGVWSLDEVMELQKKNKWPTVGNVATDVTEVFSTFLYDGTGSAQTITNSIDLSGEGGLVWIKNRDTAYAPMLFDTARGLPSLLYSSATSAADTTSGLATGTVTAFNSNGFTLGSEPAANTNGESHVSWTFRKAPKFFDVVTYTGNGTSQNISHSLGSVPGMIIVKRYDVNGENWAVYHIGLNGGTNPETKYIRLNLTNAETANTGYWNDTAPTSTQFTVGANGEINNNGGNYIAYLFAHNNNDGGFGPDQDADIIKCGYYTGNGSQTGTSVDLGFEPQWVLVKNASSSGNWEIYDVMRGMIVDTFGGSLSRYIRADQSGAENGTVQFYPTASGFTVLGSNTNSNSNGHNFIYMAIRRGPLAQPTSATNVFAIDQQNTSDPRFTSGFPVDFALMKNTAGTQDWRVTTRLISNKYLKTNLTSAQISDTNAIFDFMDGHYISNLGTNWYSWMWKRAPSYFDVVAYTGTGSNRTVSHNLGVAPEMMWVRGRDDSYNWSVYHSATGNTKYLELDGNYGANTASASYWQETDPTSSVFSVGNRNSLNKSGENFIAYLFATVAGVSKVGSYTGDGTDGRQIECGFSSGARFVLIKRSDGTGNWMVFDSVRGIVSGNDPFLKLNATSAETTTDDKLDPYSGGFIVNFSGNSINNNGNEYIFYAIAT